MNLCVQSGGAVGHFDKPTVYRLIKEAGFSSIDLNIDTCFNAGYLKDHMNEGKNPYEKGPEAVIDWYRADIDAIRDAGLYIYQAHAPFPAYRPDAPAAFVDYSIETFKVALEVCRRIGENRLRKPIGFESRMPKGLCKTSPFLTQTRKEKNEHEEIPDQAAGPYGQRRRRGNRRGDY